MATGRGELFQSWKTGLEKTKRQQRLNSTRRKSSTKEKCDRTLPEIMQRLLASKSVKEFEPRKTCQTSVPKLVENTSKTKKSPACTQNFIQRLPCEILIKILSYLDASSLFCISHVSKIFYQLNTDALWHKMYMSEFGMRWKPKCTGELPWNAMAVQQHSEGYWKRLYFRTKAGYDVNKWKRRLQEINPYTGLPNQTESVLRNMNVTWELTVTTKAGRSITLNKKDIHFFESSVLVSWDGACMPMCQHISTFELYGVVRVPLKCTGCKKPGWRSLMAKWDMGKVFQDRQFIGKDRLVKLVQQPGLIVGVWRGQNDIAFVIASLHFHKLVERSLLGSAICPYSEPLEKPPFDDIDPKYGLHGYTMHIHLHSSTMAIMSGHFTHLFCRKTQIHDGFIQLNAIKRTNLSQHTLLSGNISLPWRCGVLDGTVENCCLMSLTLLDEYQHPFWCVSTPISMFVAQRPVCYDYDGEHFLIRHSDAEGSVHMDLVWLREQRQYFLVSLVVLVAVEKVNEHFGRDY